MNTPEKFVRIRTNYSLMKLAKTQPGCQSRVHLGQKINLVISLFFMHGLEVQHFMITAM